MSQAFETRRSAAIHHGSMMEPAEIAFIPSFGNGLDKLNFSLCPELMPLFLDSYEDDEHWTLLQSLDWSFKFAPDLASLPSEITHQAQHYVYHSVRFLLLHELSHILMGHLQYLEATQGLKALPEAASQRPTTDPYILKAMEFDADVNAMAMALSGGIDTERGTLGRGASFRQNPIGLFKGVAILLTSFDVSHRSTHHYKVSTHPIPDFRYILSCLFWAPKLRSLGWEDELSPVYRRSWKEALLWAKIGTEQLGIPGGAFYSVGREIFIDFRETETIIATELSPPLVPIRDGREFSLVNYADTELANIMLARARLREDLRSPYSRK